MSDSKEQPESIGGSGSSDCFPSCKSDDKEFAESMAAAKAYWHPMNKKPMTPDEWDKVVELRRRFAVSATETHRKSVASNMPFWFVQQTARTKYNLVRAYQRVKRRAWNEKNKLAANLLHALGLDQSR